MNSVHEGLKTNLCDKTFSRPKKFERQIKTVYEELKCHNCDLCDKAFI